MNHPAPPHTVPFGAKPRRAPDAGIIAGFDDLPDSALVPVPVEAAVLGIGINTAWRWHKEGVLPPVVKIGPNTTRVSVGSIRRHMAARSEVAA